MNSTLSLPIALLLILSLVFWFVIYAKGRTFLKIAVLTLSTLLCLNVWHSIDNFLGWPSSQRIPEKFILEAFVINEPLLEGDEGSIYLWVINLNKNSENILIGYNPKEDDPRSYLIPYSKNLHKALDELRKDMANGVKMMGSRRLLQKGEDGKIGNGQSENKGRPGKDLSNEQVLEFHKLIPGILPRKN